MRKNKFYLFLITLVLLCYISVPKAYSYSEFQEVKNDGSIFFLVSLNQSELIEINCTSEFQLNYSVFLFDTRPSSSYKYLNGTYSHEIYDLAVAVSEGLNPKISYIAKENQLYYIQIIVHNESSNFISVNSNKELGRYYLPLIDSYPVELIGIFTTLTIVVISIIVRKKRKITLNSQ